MERKPTNPFNAPQGYFDLLPQETLSNVKRLNNLVGSLNDETHAATNPFAVPVDYFDALPNDMLDLVKAQPKVVALWPNRWKDWLSIAAAVAAIVLAGVPLLKQNNAVTRQPVAVLRNVSNDELYNYLSEDVGTIRVDEIAAGLPDAKLDTLERAMVAVHTAAYNDAEFDVSQVDIDDIESL